MTKQEKKDLKKRKKTEKSGLHMRVYFVLLVFLILGAAVIAVVLVEYIVKKRAVRDSAKPSPLGKVDRRRRDG